MPESDVSAKDITLKRFGFYYLGPGAPALDAEMYLAPARYSAPAAPPAAPAQIYRLSPPVPSSIQGPPAGKLRLRGEAVGYDDGRPRPHPDTEIFEQVIADAQKQLNLTLQRLADVEHERALAEAALANAPAPDTSGEDALADELKIAHREATRTLQRLADVEHEVEADRRIIDELTQQRRDAEAALAELREKHDRQAESAPVDQAVILHLKQELQLTEGRLHAAEELCRELETKLDECYRSSDDGISKLKNLVEYRKKQSQEDAAVIEALRDRLNEVTAGALPAPPAVIPSQTPPAKAPAPAQPVSPYTDPDAQSGDTSRKPATERHKDVKGSLQSQMPSILSPLSEELSAILKDRKEIQTLSHLAWELEKFRKMGSVNADAVEKQIPVLKNMLQTESQKVLVLLAKIRKSRTDLESIELECKVVQMKNENLTQIISELQ